MTLAAAMRGSVVAALALPMALNGRPEAAQSPSGRQSPPGASAGAIAITNVTVIDVLTGAKPPAVTVVTKGGEIGAVGRGLPVPRGAVRVDGAGKFLIPGLWDMHSHNQASGAESVDLYLAHGVVGTRDMGSDLDFILPPRRYGAASGHENPSRVTLTGSQSREQSDESAEHGPVSSRSACPEARRSQRSA